jgi:hypothetical protein
MSGTNVSPQATHSGRLIRWLSSLVETAEKKTTTEEADNRTLLTVDEVVEGRRP